MKETMIETEVTYIVEHAGKFYLVEHVPARVCRETGEQYFSPETVERLHALIKSNKKPDRTIETPVYEYAQDIQSLLPVGGNSGDTVRISVVARRQHTRRQRAVGSRGHTFGCGPLLFEEGSVGRTAAESGT